MTYSTLSIHQKINAKSNAGVMWGDKVSRVIRERENKNWDCRMYGPHRLALEKPGIHQNRNYDGPGDNYYQQ